MAFHPIVIPEAKIWITSQVPPNAPFSKTEKPILIAIQVGEHGSLLGSLDLL